MSLQPGTALGRYQILEPLGSGGMATVYKAYEPSLDRTVALKVIRAGLAAEADFVARFRREAQAVAKLAHPNIVQVFSFDEVEGRLFLAMQYLEGGTLKDRLVSLAPGERLPRSEVASIVSQVADALGYAHEHGIVHRDMKPSNIMLTRNRAIVTDFGIAKIVAAEQLTQTGVGIGTPEYMAPEQGAGGKLDQRADIYSLGVVAYELLTGQVPFAADTPFAVVAAHMRDPLPLPSGIDPTIGPATERALLKALAKDPAQRFATAPEFAAALSASLAGAATAASGGVAPRRSPFPVTRPALLAAAGLGVIILAAGGIAVSGAFGGGTAPASATPLSPQNAAPTAAVAAATTAPAASRAATPTPTPGPPHAVPAKGALFYQAKLDGTSSDVTGWTVDQGSPTNTEIRYVPGAIELSVNPSTSSSSNGSGQLNMPARSTYIGELDVAATTASRQGPFFIWTLRSCGSSGALRLIINLGEETVEIVDSLGSGASAAKDHLTTLIPIPSLKNGTTHTIAVVATSANVSLYLDEKQVADFPYTRCVNSTRASLGISSDPAPTGGAAVVRITGARFYALPS